MAATKWPLQNTFEYKPRRAEQVSSRAEENNLNKQIYKHINKQRKKTYRLQVGGPKALHHGTPNIDTRRTPLHERHAKATLKETAMPVQEDCKLSRVMLAAIVRKHLATVGFPSLGPLCHLIL